MTAQNVALNARLNGVFTAIPLFTDPVDIERGTKPFAGADAWPSPSRFTCTINNDTLDYDPSRPAGLLYGIAGRNTEVRIRPAGTSYLYAEATEWEPSRTPDHVPGADKGRSETGLTALGLLGRLESWTDPIDSPMFKTNSARPTSIGHWAFEEDRGATVLSNSKVGGAVGTASNVDFGEDDRPFGAKQTVKVSDASSMAGKFVAASTSAGWQVYWAFRFPELPPTSTYELFFRVNVSNGYTWYFNIKDTGFQMNTIDNLGALVSSQAFNFGAGAEPNKWVTMRIAMQQVAGNVSWNWAWYAQDLEFFYVTTGTFAGTIGVCRDWRIPGNAVTDGVHYCHVGGVTGLTEDLMSSTSRRVFNGYKLERATSRYNRLMQEVGLDRFTIGTTNESVEMGPQTIDTLVNNLRQVVATEDADISDERFDIALTMRTRRSTYNQTPALELTYPTHIADYSKQIGAAGVWNRVTAKNADGGEYTMSRTDGLMSVSPPPAGIGEIRKQVDVSVGNERTWLPMIASWHLAKGTLEGPKYTEITVDLYRHPTLVADAIDVREGDLITVSGLEPNLLRLLVVGIRRRVTSGTTRITYLTEPYDTYRVGIWDDSGFVWGTNLSRLDGAHTSTDNTLALTTDSLYGVWTANTVGRSLLIAGEQVTVSGMTAASGVGPYTQTATVTRSVNGVVKTLPDDSKVELFDNRKWGL